MFCEKSLNFGLSFYVEISIKLSVSGAGGNRIGTNLGRFVVSCRFLKCRGLLRVSSLKFRMFTGDEVFCYSVVPIAYDSISCGDMIYLRKCGFQSQVNDATLQVRAKKRAGENCDPVVNVLIRTVVHDFRNGTNHEPNSCGCDSGR